MDRDDVCGVSLPCAGAVSQVCLSHHVQLLKTTSQWGFPNTCLYMPIYTSIVCHNINIIIICIFHYTRLAIPHTLLCGKAVEGWYLLNIREDILRKNVFFGHCPIYLPLSL